MRKNLLPVAFAVALVISLAPFSVPALAAGPVVKRDGVALQLAGAESIVAAAKAKADGMGLTVNIAVVDAGGHLLAFARMDGARPASVYTSLSKAATAALKLGDTGPLAPTTDDPAVHLNLAVENAAAMSGGKFTTLEGGVAVIVDGQVIGGIGVGGAKGSEDAVIAKAGLSALVEAVGE